MAEQELIRGALPQTLTWNGPEFHHHEKDESWNKGLVLVAFLLVIFALWQRNFLFIVIILLSTWLLARFAHQKPNMIDFVFDNKGFVARNKQYTYKEMEGFALQTNEREDLAWNKLIIRTKSHWTPHIVILIPKDRTSEIHTFLTEYLPEVNHEDSFIDIISDLLKF